MGFDYRTYTGLGKQTLGGHKQKLVCTRTREKGVGTPQGTDPGLPAGVQESLAEAWVDSVLLARSGALSAVVPAWDLWKEEAIILITSTLVCSPSNNREGNSPVHQQKIGLNIY